MEKSKRIFYFDFLRAMAIIGIIFCHSSVSYIVNDMGTFNFYTTAFYDCFRDFCVPIFVMLSGALLIGKKDSLLIFFKKRLSRILIPFIFWALISIAYSFIYIQQSIDIDNAIDIFLGHGGTLGVTFWFVWMIIIVYIGIFIINKAVEFGNKKYDCFEKKFISILTVISVIYIILFQFQFFSPEYNRSLLSYYLSFLAYAVIGHFIVNSDFLESHIQTKWLVIIFSILSALSYTSYVCYYVVPTSLASNSFRYLSYFTYEILIISVAIFLTVKFISNTHSFKKLEAGKISGIINAISKYSFGIYLCHYLVLYILKMNMIQYIDFPHQNSIIWIPIFVVITLMISFAILWLLNNVPYLKKVSGVS